VLKEQVICGGIAERQPNGHRVAVRFRRALPHPQGNEKLS
jgi:hypothetical protein